MYEALGPAAGQPDFRVVAASTFVDKDGNVSAAVKNRHDL